MREPKLIYIYGTNAVKSALSNRPDIFERVFLARDKDADKEILELIKKNNIKKETFVDGDLARDLKEANHQGVLAKIDISLLEVSFEYFLENLQIDANTCLVLLGELTDPQNVGSIMRSAAALGIAGILIPEHDQAQISGSVVKVSAGAAFTLPLVRIGNVREAIKKLKEKRFWIYGLDMEGEKNIYEENYTEATVFVVGNEGEGLRAKTREDCDMILSIPMNQNTESLNAGVSTAVAMYEWRRQRLLK